METTEEQHQRRGLMRAFSFVDDTRQNQHWKRVFDRYDQNGDGVISFTELCTAIQTNERQDIPKETVRMIMLRADEDENGTLSYEEFVKMIHNPENRNIFGHLLNRYVQLTIPRRKTLRQITLRDDEEMETDSIGEYEGAYSCWPPAVGMILLSLIEIGTYMYDSINAGNTMATGPAATVLIYDPFRRDEAWRYLTYMFVHVGYCAQITKHVSVIWSSNHAQQQQEKSAPLVVADLEMKNSCVLAGPENKTKTGSHKFGPIFGPMHLIVNLVVQIMLGIPLEMVHHSWRVAVVYLAGVVAGSLGTSITDPTVFLAGASGGVYALITAHISTIIMNWSEMQYAIWQLLFFIVLTSADVGSAIYNRYVLEQQDKVGYSAHFCGAIAGLLVGINVLRNLDIKSWEKKLWWASLVFYIVLMLSAIIWNIAFPSYFP